MMLPSFISVLLSIILSLPLVFSQSSNSSSSSNSTSSSIRTSINLPPSLNSCSPSSWIYTAPIGPKYLGFFVSGTDRFIETFKLPSVYDEKTEGSFVWMCDFPPGLSVAAMFYVIEEGATGTNGHQTTTPDTLVNAPASSDGTTNQCYGQNDLGAQKGILSLASSLDPTFTYTAGSSSSTSANGSSNNKGSGNSTPVGAIIGAVLGGLTLIIILILLLIYLRRKHDQANGAFNDAGSVYSGWTEKTRRDNIHSGIGGGAGGGNTLPPPGTYYATDPEGNTILVMGQPPHPASSPPLLNHQHPHSQLHSQQQSSVAEIPSSPPHSQQQQQQQQPGTISGSGTGPVPRMTAPIGTLPEPMGDDEESPQGLRRPTLHPKSSIGTGLESYQTAHTSSGTSTPRAFEIQSERNGGFYR
ncbi:hypothetical protein JCM3765_004707 [Sporobolomyces pararoseus]